MRLALASVTVLAAAAASSLALAQDPPPAAAPVEAAPPAATAPAPAAAPTDPMAMQPGQMAPAAPAAAAAPKPPFQPAPVTDPAAVAVMSALTNVCIPSVKGGKLDDIAKAAGYKLRRGVWTMPTKKPLALTIDPAGANPTVCTITVDYAIGPDEPIYTALNEWAFVQQPELVQYRNDEYADSEFKRRTLSWEGTTPDNITTGLVYIQLKKPDGTPATRNAERSQVLFTVRQSSPE